MTQPDDSRTHQKIEAVWRIESARLIAGLARIVRDIGIAEDLAADALVAALQQWPAAGIPDNPGAWLMGTAKHRAIDHVRRRQMLERKHGELKAELEPQTFRSGVAPDIDAALDDDVGDDMLRLIFTACHPVLSQESRAALTLRLIAGLTTDEIARAYLVPEPTIAQRIVRAKKTLAAKQVPYEVPRGEDRAERLGSVLEVIYLIFNEGYTATAGAEWIRHGLCEEALRLSRMLAELSPSEAEVHGLSALLEIQASRLRARVGRDGQAILLADQNRALWDRLLIRRGLDALDRARLAGPLGPYAVQAAIAACHARAVSVEQTDWRQIIALYDALAGINPSPVVALNRAVAVSMADGPAQALEEVDRLKDSAALRNYHLLPAVRADLLKKIGRMDEARTEFERAASLTRNEAERSMLMRRAGECQRAI